jgi:predicted Fe-Mo cluster-binding NifX family protein
MQSLGMEVIDNVGRMTVRRAIEFYTQGSSGAIQAYKVPPEKIAVASRGSGLEATIHSKDEPCTSFVLVNPETMDWELIQIEPAESLSQASIHAVRAAALAGATVVITSGLRSECCTALGALAIAVALAPEGITVREAIERFQRGELSGPANRT